MWIFPVIALAIVLLTHAWLGFRLCAPFEPPGARLIWILLMVNALAMPLAMVVTYSGRGDRVSLVAGAIGFSLIGLWSVLVAAMLGWEVLRLVTWAWDGLVAITDLPIGSNHVLPIDPVRRLQLQRAGVGAVLGATFLVGVLGIIGGLRGAVVEGVSIEIPHLAPGLEGLRIVQISDLHVGPTNRGSFVREVVEQVNALQPDLVAVTGDLADGSVSALQSKVAPLADLRAPLGVFFVTGNHEYYSGVHAWLEEMRRLGMVTLVNEHRVLEHDGASLLVAGIPDHRAASIEPSHVPNPLSALDGAPTGVDVKVLLAHQPRSAPAAAEAGFDLVLAGHTHGGQYVPWTWVIHLVEPYVRGLHHIGSTQLWVSRGTGTWGPPMRLGSHKEITLLVLTDAHQDA